MGTGQGINTLDIVQPELYRHITDVLFSEEKLLFREMQ
jgi:hypothetical protein